MRSGTDLIGGGRAQDLPDWLVNARGDLSVYSCVKPMARAVRPAARATARFRTSTVCNADSTTWTNRCNPNVVRLTGVAAAGFALYFLSSCRFRVAGTTVVDPRGDKAGQPPKPAFKWGYLTFTRSCISGATSWLGLRARRA